MHTYCTCIHKFIIIGNKQKSHSHTFQLRSNKHVCLTVVVRVSQHLRPIGVRKIRIVLVVGLIFVDGSKRVAKLWLRKAFGETTVD